MADFILSSDDESTINLQGTPDETFIFEGGEMGPPGPQGHGVPAGGNTGDTLTKTSNSDYATGWSSSTSGQGTSRIITQTAHGFTVGQILKISSGYALSQANSAANADVVGMVLAVNSANSFTLVTEGYVSGLSGLTAGGVYFLSPSAAGGMTLTEPIATGQVRKPVFYAESATAGYFHNYEGVVVGGTGAGGGGGTPLSYITHAGNYTFTDSDDTLVETTAGSTVTMHNPTTALFKRYTVVNTSAGNITIAASTINGAATYVLYPGLTVDLLPVSGNFIII